MFLRPGFHMKSLFKESPSIQVNNLHRERESLHPRMLQRGNVVKFGGGSDSFVTQKLENII